MAIFIGIFIALAVINVLLLLFSTSQRIWRSARRTPKQPSVTKSKVVTQG